MTIDNSGDVGDRFLTILLCQEKKLFPKERDIHLSEFYSSNSSINDHVSSILVGIRSFDQTLDEISSQV